MSRATAQVEVLLSTYDGERYLSPLLESVRSQTIENFRVRIRDDGSTDATASVVAQWAERDPRISVEVGPNLGAAQSFLTLLRSVDADTDVVALCDQDDVWVPDKLRWGLEALSGAEGPTLYCGGIVITDEELRPLRAHRIPRRGLTFANALVENVATGATIMLNRAAIDLVDKARPQSLVMHDHWLYLLVSGCGTVVYDPRPHVLYRQHGTNTVGIAQGWEDWRHRARRHRRSGHERVLTAQARELRRLHGGDLRPGPRRQLEQFLDSGTSWASRLRYAAVGDCYRQRPIDDLVFKVLYALGRV